MADVGASAVEVANFLPSAGDGFGAGVEVEGNGVRRQMLRPVAASVGVGARAAEDVGVEVR